MNPPDRIAFLEVCAVDKDCYRAGALATDRLTDPIEFRCTAPVRPTRIHKVLWGRRLTGHLMVHALAKPVFDALAAGVRLVVVHQRQLLDLRPLVGCAVVQLAGRHEEAGGRLLAARPAPIPGQVGEPEPIYLRAAAGFPTDLDLAAELLGPTAAELNPHEPFARVREAVGLIHQEETTVKAV